MDCLFCEEAHAVPSNGFPLNINLKAIVNQNENNFKAAKNSINLSNCSVKSLMKAFSGLKQAIKNPVDEAKQYCNELKRLVQLSTEEKILQINSINEVFIDQRVIICPKS